MSATSFALLPLCVRYVSGMETLLYATVGGIVFVITTVLFDPMVRRFFSGQSTKTSPHCRLCAVPGVSVLPQHFLLTIFFIVLLTFPPAEPGMVFSVIPGLS